MSLYFGHVCAWMTLLILLSIVSAFVRFLRNGLGEYKFYLFGTFGFSLVAAIFSYFAHTLLLGG